MRHFAAMAAGILTALFVLGAAHAQSPTPDSIAAARELVVASGAGDKFTQLLPIIMQQLKPVVVQGRPEVERDFDQIMPLMMEAASQNLSKLMDAVAEVYVRNFTIEEMRNVTAFYRTPTGQKLVEKLPVVMQQSMQAGNKIGQEIMQELQARITDELRKRGHKI